MEDHGAPEARQSLGPGPEVVKRLESPKSEWHKESIAGVLGRLSAGAAGRIFDTANPRVIRA